MAYTLPLTNQLWPDTRILWRQGFGAGTGTGNNKAVSGSGWRILPNQRRGPLQHGFFFRKCERGAFPFIGTASFAYYYGQFDDTAVDSIDLPELNNAEIRIQVTPKGAETWRTIWWGTVDYIEDRGSPGATVARGIKIFHCVDGFYRTKRWMMDRHGYSATGGLYGVAQFGNAVGHPGYNWSRSHDSVTSGNKSPSQYTNPAGVTVTHHTPAGAGSKWTDLEAVEHALGASKPPGEPLFTLSGATDLLSGTNAWEVKHGESVFDFCQRILKRERGRGLCYVDWDDDSAAPTGPLTVKLTIGAQLAANLSYTDPTSGSTVTIQGATARGRSTTVDITGDHRAVDGSLSLGDPDQFRVAYLETEGEEIEVLAPLSYVDGLIGTAPLQDGLTLCRGWSELEQNTYVGLSAVRRQEARFKPVFQLHRLNPAWGGYAGNGNGGAKSRIDYRTTSAGRIVTPETATAAEKADPVVTGGTSPLLVEVLPDLPLFEGYAYNGATVQRADGASETDNPQRRKLTGYVRVADDRYIEFDQTGDGSVHMSVDGNSVWIIHSGDEGGGTRYFSTSTTANLSSAYNYTQIVLTVGLRLPHRVRFASGDPNTSKRRGKISVPGSHLWLAAPGAIYDLNTATTSGGGYAPRRGALGATATSPGILRDDRSGLAAIHALSWAWYGDDTDHRSASWALKACGFLSTYDAFEGTAVGEGSPTSVSYPTLGQVVTTLTANGTTYTLNTPVTRVAYDNERGITTWSTEWNDLERQ